MPQGLGRGLGSLIPKKTVTYGQNPYNDKTTPSKKGTATVLKDGDRILKISPDQISYNPLQPRTVFADSALKDLAASIKEHGIIQPLVACRKGNVYELIAGERRLRAARLLGLTEVPVIIRKEKDQKKLELALIENLQRENLNPIESARAYQRLIDEFNLTQEEAAHQIGKARSSIANALRLLVLPQPIQEALSAGRISEAHAKYLLGLEGEERQLNMLKHILRQNLSVAETDKEIKRLGGTKRARQKDFQDRAREEKLSQILNTKVELKRSGLGGKIVIDFYSEEELEQILKKIK